MKQTHIGSDCYFNKGTYLLWIGIVVASCLLFVGIIVWGNSLQSGGDISSTQKTFGARYILLALYAPFLVFGEVSVSATKYTRPAICRAV
jgi:hypothetical protein